MINKHSVVPYYHQLAYTIIEQIDNGTIPKKSKLPSERTLCKMYGVSRATVRQAINELQRLGYVVSKQGKGNFAAMPVLRQQLLNIYSFSDEMRKKGKVPTTRLLNHQIVHSDSFFETEMGWKQGEPLYCFQRLRLADNEPVMAITTYLPVFRFPDFDCTRLSHASLYMIMNDEYDLKLTEVHESLRAIAIPSEMRQLLDVPTGSPVMKSIRKSYEGTLAVEYGEGITRGDFFEYDVVMRDTSDVIGLI